MLENESKRNRALKRATDEKKQREAKESEIRGLESQLKQILKQEASLKQQVEKNIKYQDYLESVVQGMSKFFPEISDILNRYTTLKKANTDLLEKQQADETLNENTLREYLSYRKDKENQILNHNNEIAEMQLRMERAQTRTMWLQGEIDGAISEASDKALSLGQILSSVSNILDSCEENFRRRHNKPQVSRKKNSCVTLHSLYGF
jgi:chromosome segregation ATPase